MFYFTHCYLSHIMYCEIYFDIMGQISYVIGI